MYHEGSSSFGNLSSYARRPQGASVQPLASLEDLILPSYKTKVGVRGFELRPLDQSCAARLRYTPTMLIPRTNDFLVVSYFYSQISFNEQVQGWKSNRWRLV